MCGIVGVFELKQEADQLRGQVLKMSGKLRHRGPDWSGIYVGEKAILAHQRLAIVDPQSGQQPLYSADGNVVLAVNGEIYNHQELRKELPDYPYKTNSDCEVILALYQEYGVDFVEKLNGMFAFALYDQVANRYMIARDHMGIIPLYQGTDIYGNYYVASELKALEGVCTQIDPFQPGHYYTSDSDEPVQWYKRDWMEYEAVQDNTSDTAELRAALEASVKRQLMSDVPYGVLLSGGLDSSLTAAIAKSYAGMRVESGGKSEAWYPQLHSFAIGDVIYHLETYDITTVRASTPMYLLARVIKSMGIKMVLSGEGADEIFGGYWPGDKKSSFLTVWATTG